MLSGSPGRWWVDAPVLGDAAPLPVPSVPETGPWVVWAVVMDPAMLCCSGPRTAGRWVGREACGLSAGRGVQLCLACGPLGARAGREHCWTCSIARTWGKMELKS